MRWRSGRCTIGRELNRRQTLLLTEFVVGVLHVLFIGHSSVDFLVSGYVLLIDELIGATGSGRVDFTAAIRTIAISTLLNLGKDRLLQGTLSLGEAARDFGDTGAD